MVSIQTPADLHARLCGHVNADIHVPMQTQHNLQMHVKTDG